MDVRRSQPGCSRRSERRKLVPTWGTAIARWRQGRSGRGDPGGRGMVAVGPRAASTWKRVPRVCRGRRPGGGGPGDDPEPHSPRRAEALRSGPGLVPGSRLSPTRSRVRRVRRRRPAPERRCRADFPRRRGPRRRAPAAHLLPRGARPGPAWGPPGSGPGSADCGPALWARALGGARRSFPGILVLAGRRVWRKLRDQLPRLRGGSRCRPARP